MKIVCDDKIPYIREALASLTNDVLYKPGAGIAPADVRDADALIVRTRTRCDRRLLEGSRVALVVTATIGHDHIDAPALDALGIAWTNCPGCNATSVAQWVRNALIATGVQLAGKRVGIVGYGHVGRAVAEALRPYGCRLVLCDPPLGLHGDVADCDVITFHTPLTDEGPHATRHLADDRFFSRLRRPAVVVNAARGGVVDEAALLRAIDCGRVSAALVDTWEGEPHVNPELLRRAAIATPHIAGYSADGKANASRMAVEAVARHFGLQADTTTIVPPPADRVGEGPLALYDPRRDTEALRRAPQDFERLRGEYPVRREV